MKSFLAWRLRTAIAVASRCRPKARRPCGRTLAIVTGGLGDKLMALPAIRHLRREFSDRELTLLFLGVAPPFCEGEADRVLSIPVADTRGLIRIARHGADTCFVNSIGVYDVRCELAAFLSGARDTRGPRYAHLAANRIVFTRSYIFGDGHETALNLRGAGESPETTQVPYRLRIPDPPPTVDEIIFHPGSSAAGLPNRWPTASYAALAQSLRDAGHQVVAVGSPEERDLLEHLHELARGSVEICTELTLEELALRLAAARLVVANDSGVGHLAAAVGAPLVTIMGANQPERVAPVGDRVTLIGPRCEFGGCYNTPRAKDCLMCIERISPEEVRDAVLARIA